MKFECNLGTGVNNLVIQGKLVVSLQMQKVTDKLNQLLSAFHY